MYLLFKNLHSIIAALSLLLLFFAVGYAGYKFLKKHPFTPTSKIIVLAALIATHIQLLLGIVLYLLSPLGISNFSAASMKNGIARLYILEHPLLMILAAILITLGYSRAKKTDNDSRKFKGIGLYYITGLLLILSRVPWHAW